MNKKTLKKKADLLFSKMVRRVGKCELEGKDSVTCNGVLQCMHIIGRSNHHLRWDTQNALCGCQGHHMYYTNHPWEFQEMIKVFYPERYEYLNKERHTLWNGDIQAVLATL